MDHTTLLRKRVLFVELPVFSGIVPLASGYMEAVCRNQDDIASRCTFKKISSGVHSPYQEILRSIVDARPHIIGFSCYVWNTQLVRRLVLELVEKNPELIIILGGPQVMHQGLKYLDARNENIFICNGEGERTFPNFLRTLLAGQSFSEVRGLSFYKDGLLITTEAEQRIRDLEEIPSPFLNGIFDDQIYTWMLIETNRGCPFSCNYCYWGAATGTTVHKFLGDRIKNELAWIAKSNCFYLFIADANWGMLKRDVDISNYIVDMHKEFGSPLTVYFCGSKNTPDRVTQIADMFHQAGMVSAQSISIQSMDTKTLKQVDRENIKLSGYTTIQQHLNERDISSFIEIIWPLPGETLSSFRRGLCELCEIGADSIIVYSLLLMNNVELANKREEFGLITVRDPDPNSEAEIVIATRDVDSASYKAGYEFTYTVMALHCLRGLRCLGSFLNSTATLSYGDFFQRFTDFWKKDTKNPWSIFCSESLTANAQSAFDNGGQLVHHILHGARDEFDRFLTEFVQSQEFWNDPSAQMCFELDLLNRPYIYSNTKIQQKNYRFAHLKVSAIANGYEVECSDRLIELARLYLKVNVNGWDKGLDKVVINHRRAQLPFMPRKTLREHFVYAQDTSQRMKHIVPSWTGVGSDSYRLS